jgi:hypothetical protein
MLTCDARQALQTTTSERPISAAPLLAGQTTSFRPHAETDGANKESFSSPSPRRPTQSRTLVKAALTLSSVQRPPAGLQLLVGSPGPTTVVPMQVRWGTGSRMQARRSESDPMQRRGCSDERVTTRVCTSTHLSPWRRLFGFCSVSASHLVSKHARWPSRTGQEVSRLSGLT